MLLHYAEEFGTNVSTTAVREQSKNKHENPYDLVNPFYSKYNPNDANLELLMEVLALTETYSQSGTVLVFLPGYDDLMELRNMICANSSPLKQKLEVHVLYGHMSLEEFNKLSLPVAAGLRRVILATSIAETSISPIFPCRRLRVNLLLTCASTLDCFSRSECLCHNSRRVYQILQLPPLSTKLLGFFSRSMQSILNKRLRTFNFFKFVNLFISSKINHNL